MEGKDIGEIVPEDHPERCHGMAAGNQCLRRQVPGSKFCRMHGGNVQDKINKEKSLYDFNVTKWKTKFKNFTDHKKWRSVEEELGVLRMVIQGIIEKAESQNDLVMFSSQLGDLIDKAAKLVNASLKLDKELKHLISKEEMLVKAYLLVEAVSEEVKDPEICERLAARFQEIIMSNQQENENAT